MFNLNEGWWIPPAILGIIAIIIVFGLGYLLGILL